MVANSARALSPVGGGAYIPYTRLTAESQLDCERGSDMNSCDSDDGYGVVDDHGGGYDGGLGDDSGDDADGDSAGSGADDNDIG